MCKCHKLLSVTVQIFVTNAKFNVNPISCLCVEGTRAKLTSKLLEKYDPPAALCSATMVKTSTGHL